MADEERLRQIEHQLSEVDASNISLRESIEGIRVPLDVLADVQREQGEVRRAAEIAKNKAVAVEAATLTRAARAKRVAGVALVALAILAGSTYWNHREIAANNARWCPVVEPLAPRAGDPEPVGDSEQVQRSIRIRRAFSDLVDDFGCR
jgi:hypothetical protein